MIAFEPMVYNRNLNREAKKERGTFKIYRYGDSLEKYFWLFGVVLSCLSRNLKKRVAFLSWYGRIYNINRKGGVIMSEKKAGRRRFSPQEKVRAVKQHLLQKKSISAICEELNIHPNQYNEWQRQFFENGERAFDRKERKQQRYISNKLEKLEKTVAHKDSVISQIASEYVELKKNLGEI